MNPSPEFPLKLIKQHEKVVLKTRFRISRHDITGILTDPGAL